MSNDAWREQCVQRKVWINEANIAWRHAIAQQQKIKNEQDELVRAARTEFMRRRAVPAPAREDFV